MVQHALPNSDVATGAWFALGAGTFFSEMGEGDASTDGETSYCQNPNTDVLSTILEVGLSAVTNPNGTPVATNPTNWKQRVRARRGTTSCTLTFALRQAGATISTSTQTLSNAYQLYDDSLTQAEVDNITEAGFAGGLSVQFSKSAVAVLARVTTYDLFIVSEIARYASLLDWDLTSQFPAASKAFNATILDYDLATSNITALAAMAASIFEMDTTAAKIDALAALRAIVLDLELVHAENTALANLAATILEADVDRAGPAALTSLAATLIDLEIAYAPIQAAGVITDPFYATALDWDVVLASPRIAQWATERWSHALGKFIPDDAHPEFHPNRPAR